MNAALIIGNLAYATTTAALLVHDILWLRVLGALANLCFIAANVLGASGPNYVFMAWSLLFLLINLVQIARLIAERLFTRLGPEDEDIHVSVFPNLSLGEFRLLLKAGRRREVGPGDILAQEGMAQGEVILLERGGAVLRRGGADQERLSPGDLLGEVAFVAKRPFSTTAVVEAPSRIVAWDRDVLTRLFVRRPALALGFQAAFIGRLRRSELPTSPQDRKRSVSNVSISG